MMRTTSEASPRRPVRRTVRPVQSEVVGRGIPFAEGPVWCPDGTVVATSVAAGALFRVQPETGTVEQIAVTTGGANGAALAADGSILVTQNGGIDFSKLPGVFADVPRDGAGHAGTPTRRTPTAPSPTSPTTASAARTTSRSRPTARCTSPIPGTSRRRDDGHGPRDDLRARRIGDARSPPASSTATASRSSPTAPSSSSSAAACNACSPTARASGSIAKLGRGGGDGFCLDADGRFYVASTIEHGIRVVDPDGTVVDFLPIDGEGLTTNCCFGGDDLRTLFVTDALPGDLVAFEGMPTPGLPLPTWPGPQRV